MSLLSDIAAEINVLIKHNPKVVNQIEVTVAQDADTLKADLVQVVEAYLTAKGVTLPTVAESAATAALNLVQAAVTAAATSAVTGALANATA